MAATVQNDITINYDTRRHWLERSRAVERRRGAMKKWWYIQQLVEQR